MPAVAEKPADKPVVLKSLDEIPDKVFEGPVPKKRSMSDYVKTGAPKPEPKPPEAEKVEEPEATAPESKTEAEEMFAEVPKPKEAPKPAEKQEEAKTEEPKTEKQTEVSQPEVPAQRTPGGKLREVLETTLSENKQLKAELEQLRALADAGKEVETIKQKASAMEQRLQFVDYQASEEFHEKYQAPLDNAIKAGLKIVSRAKNKTADRPGNSDDIWKLSRMYANDLEGAVETAEEMFGKAAPEVLAAARAISEANEAASEALDTWKKEAPKRVEMTLAQQREMAGNTRKVYESQAQNLTKLRPDLFDFSGDPELAAIHNEYVKKVDGAFFPEDGADRETMVRRSAMARVLAASALPTAIKLARAQEEITSLKKQLSELQDSSPDVMPSGGENGKTGEKTSRDSLRSYVDRARAR